MRRPRVPSKRRVVIATRLFAPEPAAAAFRQAALARALHRAGADVEVLTTRLPGGVPDDRWPGGLRVRRWPVLRDAGGNVRGYLQYASFDVPLVLRLLLGRRPSAVVAEPPPTTGVVVRLVSRLRRVPYVYYASDVLWLAAEGIGVHRLVVRLLRALERWALSGASAVLTVSDGVRDQVLLMGVDPARVVTVGTGVDTGVFGVVGPAEPARRPTFVYAGTMSENQGAGVFVEALGRLRSQGVDARLVVLGQGVEEDELRALAERVAPGAVDFRGRVPAAQVARTLRSATAGLASVRPGRGYDFAFPTKALVPLACGVPVLYAGPGPCSRLVREHRLGEAVDWDPAEVASAMRRLVDTEWSPDDAARAESWVQGHHSLQSVAQGAVECLSDRLDLGCLPDRRADRTGAGSGRAVEQWG